MPLGFYTIMAAQFFSALADNALLIAAIALLRNMQAPAEQEPLLKLFFTISYVVLAAFVGAFADSMPKWRVMLISNTVKIVGCLMMLMGVQPLLAYAVVGLGGAAYSPAKYGILTEYLPPRLLVVANGWIEGLTVGAIILGTVLGGMLIRSDWMGAAVQHLPFLNSYFQLSVLLIGLIYLVAAAFNLYIPDTGVDHKPLKNNPLYLIHDFNHSLRLLWRDKLGQISLAVTTLFWGAGATLQFIVIKWAEHALQFDLSQAALLQGVVAVGVALGAVLAAKHVSLRDSVRVIPLGIVMGLVVMVMVMVPHIPHGVLGELDLFQWHVVLEQRTLVSILMLIVIGALSGFFVVPMNALLQHRGHILMGAGHSIAVQNFNENLSILAMTGIYALLIASGLSVNAVIIAFGLFVSAMMMLIKRLHEANQRRSDSLKLLDDPRR